MKDSLMDVLISKHKKKVVFYGISQKDCSMSEGVSFSAYYMDVDNVIEAKEACKVCSFQQAKEVGIDTFVIMRQMIANQNSFQQILEYCDEFHADVYDEVGRDLRHICKEVPGLKASDKAVVLSKIRECEWISFDIFDTLLMRKVLLPEDVFELVERRLCEEGIVIKNFAEKRKHAQEVLGLTNPNIYEIYAQFKKKYRVSSAICERCCKLELEIEKEVLIPREDILDVYRQCLSMGKKVVLISDMYIPKEELRLLLENNEIVGYEKLYVSCDYRRLKLQGLFECFLEEMEPSSCVHIGDHVIHDGICARIAGVQCCLINNGTKHAKETILGACFQEARTIHEHILLGLVVAKLFNSPFASVDKNGKISITSEYEYAYCFCATLISEFVIWLYDEVKRGRFTDVLFAARDGYLLMEMYRRLLERWGDENLPKGKYFYTSRKAAVMTSINNEAFINMVIDMSLGMPPKKLMRERFGLENKRILEYDEEKYGDSIHQYVWDHVGDIFERAEEAKRNYFRYMGQCDLVIGGKYAFVDFVSSGTSQKALARIVPFELQGLYVGWNAAEPKETVGVHSLYEGMQMYFMRKYKIMETFVTSNEPSVEYINKDGKPVFARQERTEKELQYIQVMQDACLDYFENFLALLPLEDDKVAPMLSNLLFETGEAAIVKNEKSVLNHLKLMDDWRKVKYNINDLLM